ncbi:MAG: hypothetical protein M1480_17615 [Bacteroidetes bacterium]|nr:hypothetical protein [Bacteroidota bacterium]
MPSSKRYNKNDFNDNTHIKLLLFPKNKKYHLIKYFNRIYLRMRLKKLLATRFDVLWLTHPVLLDFISVRQLQKMFLVYDCMDLNAEFPDPQKSLYTTNKMQENERLLIESSKLIICSSDSLKSELTKKYNLDREVFVVNNGINLQDYELDSNLNCRNNKERILTYVGTISSWMDFELILHSLNYVPNLVYHLWGQLEIAIPKHERIIYNGIAAKKEIIRILRNSTGAVMPFKKSIFTDCIDAVKLYEYIYSCVPSIVISTRETERLNEYVYCYKDEKDYLRLVQQSVTGKLSLKKGVREHFEFVDNNSWEVRAEKLKMIIDNKIVNVLNEH